MVWRTGESPALLQLLDQVDALYPHRNKSSDGTIAGAAHHVANPTSDHEQDRDGHVHALDITHDPAHGCNSYVLAEQLRQSHDPRIKYIISKRRICGGEAYAERNHVKAWEWGPYYGSNPHTEHVHISVVKDPALFNSRKPWVLGPAQPTPAPQPAPAPIPTSDNFAKWLKPLLGHEGGNDNDADDPGGRTSRGITQNEFNEWRKRHAGLPQDVWKAPQSTIEAIFRQDYWNVLSCDLLPRGLDYAVFDFGVNSGVFRSAQLLQRLVGVATDGHIGPLTEAAAAKLDARTLINKFCDERMAYLKGRPVWWKYKNGWTTRVNDVRRDALAAVAS